MENVGIVLDWIPQLLLTEYRLLSIEDICDLDHVVRRFTFSFV